MKKCIFIALALFLMGFCVIITLVKSHFFAPHNYFIYVITWIGLLYTSILSIIFVVFKNFRYKKAAHELTLCNQSYKTALAQWKNQIFEYDICQKRLYVINKSQGKRIDISKNLEGLTDEILEDGIIDADFMAAFKIMIENFDFNSKNLSHTICTSINGVEIWRRITFKVTLDGGVPIKITSIVHDITKEKASLGAGRDSLTGLYNRATLEDMVISSICANKSDKYAFIMLDTDNFKDINDIYGHYTGDFVLCNIAKILNLTFRKSDVVSRMGGDEFCVFMKNITSTEVVLKKANEVINELSTITCGDLESLSVTMSIGIAIYPDHGLTFSDLYQNADRALYAAKANGKACPALFKSA